MMAERWQQRCRQEGLKAGVVLSLAFCYYLFTQITGWAVPCLFHVATGLYCPGCGITHLCIDLLHLRLTAAFMDNPVCFLLLPVLAVLLGMHEVRYIRSGKRTTTKWENLLYILIVVTLLAFGVIRNLVLFF